VARLHGWSDLFLGQWRGETTPTESESFGDGMSKFNEYHNKIKKIKPLPLRIFIYFMIASVVLGVISSFSGESAITGVIVFLALGYYLGNRNAIAKSKKKKKAKAKPKTKVNKKTGEILV
jgi:hypothetical protein